VTVLAGWAPEVDLWAAQWDELPPAVQDTAVEQAVRLLWALTGRQLGTRTVQIAPFVPLPRVDYFTGLTRHGTYGTPLGGIVGSTTLATVQVE
jgi:hypothetical protein